MHIASPPILEIRRIILFDGKNPDVLIDPKDNLYALPEIEIPRWQRVAESLTHTMSTRCGIDAVSVSSLEMTPGASRPWQVRYEIMQTCLPSRQPPFGRNWIAVDSLTESQFRDPIDFEAVLQAYAQCRAYAQNSALGSFGALGWFSNLKHWVQQEIRTHGLQLNGKFRQLNSCSTFSLIRFETDGPAVWFKAVGTPNQREYPVTIALARLFPRFLPRIISTLPQSNGWLAFETQGPLLRDCLNLDRWNGTAADLAEIQIDSLGRTTQLLDVGGRDLRNCALAGLLEPFFQTMNGLMQQQTKMSPAPLSQETLRCLYARVRDALAVLEAAAIPDTLGHLDLNPGNIICTGTGSVFLDWAEAFVGHPFFTFQYLLEHFRRTIGPNPSHEAQMVSRYSSLWRPRLSENDIRRALDLVPLLAVYVCAVGNNLWTDPEKLEEQRIAGYLRSLTRQMERQACAIAQRSLSCPS